MKSSKLVKSLLLTSVLLSTGGAIAATDSDTMQINLEIPAVIKLTGLTNITLPAFSGTAADSVGTDTFCIYSNTSTYAITMTSGYGVASFKLQGDDINTYLLPYEVVYNSSSMASGTATTGLSDSDKVSLNCASGDTGTVTVTVVNGQITQAPAASYNDTLTVLVATE